MTFLLASILLLAPSAMVPVPPEPTLPPGTATVFLVRHAEKSSSGKNPDLTTAGKARAEVLYEMLSKRKLDLVIVSDTKRAEETADHTARQHGITPLVVSTGGGVDTHVKNVVAAVRDVRAGGGVLIVGHSNTIPLIVEALGGPSFPALCENEYATYFVLELSGDGTPPKLTRSTYGAPDPPGAADCVR
jgi:broad specificity phosphatase PhoE